MNATIPHILLNRVISKIPIAAMKLQRIVADVEALLCRKQLGHTTQSHRVLVLVLQGQRRIANQKSRSHQIRRHFGELKLQVLELIERFAELFSSVHVLNALIDAGLGCSQATAGNVHTTAVQAFHGD